MSFRCRLCLSPQPLDSLADAACNCLCCGSCTETALLAQVTSQLSPPAWPPPLHTKHRASKPHAYAVGDRVSYITRDRTLAAARVVQIDRAVQPPQYGITLEPDTNVRYTEFDRLLPSADQEPGSASLLIPRAPRLTSPCCGQSLTLPQLQTLSPEASRLWHEATTALWLHLNNIIRCPASGCGALIQREAPPQQQGPGQQQQQQQQQQRGAAQSAAHKQQHRFRCSMCRRDFCDSCRACPYHEGLTCEEHAMPDCLYCGCKVQAGADTSSSSSSGGGTTSGLRQALGRLGVDSSWCIEKGELQALAERFRGRVCGGAACREKLAGSCTRRLACGHWCVGVRGEPPDACPPCAACTPPGGGGDGYETCCQLCLEPLAPGPAVQLSCLARHMCHLECCRRRLEAGCPGPELSFGHLFCPVCREEEGVRGGLQIATGRVHLDHPSLEGATLSRALELRSQVVALAKAQLREEGLLASEPELQPGGRYEGRPADYAVCRFAFYECGKCGLPYHGGARVCRAAGGGAVDRSELVCGGCSVATGAAGEECAQHGRTFIEFKCRYCCNLASWYCWGSTHMCNACHEQPARRSGTQHRCDPNSCPLPVRPHPPPGDEFCMGCGLCRRGAGRGGGKRN